VEQFVEAVQAAAARIIGEQRYVAHPDDVDDIFIRGDSLDLPDFADIETAIVDNSQARRAVGLPVGDPVPLGYGVGFMRRWLSEYRDAGGNFHTVADEVVAMLEQRLRDFAVLDVVPAVVLTSIHGLAIHGRTKLDETTDLVLIRQERDVRHAFEYTFSFPQAADWLSPATVALRQRVELGRDAPVDFTKSFDRADKFIAALRLAEITRLTPGDHVIATRRPAFSLPGTQVKALRIERRVVPAVSTGLPQELGDRTAPVQAMFAKLDNNHDTALAFAVRRFNDADERVRDEDVVFDCFSALEALFAGGSTTELTYRLSLRAAKVLRATAEERIELFKRIKKLYGTRSKIVHGGQVPKDRLAADAAEAMALLRTAITAWLDAGGYDGEQLDELLLE
jgi:hypothetical protein